MTDIAFLGKDEITQVESSLLETFGFFLAEEGNQLHLSKLSGADGALARGWAQSTHRTPPLHKKGLDKTAPELILYVTNSTLARILTKMPTDDTPRMTIITTIEQLRLCAEISLGVIEERKSIPTESGQVDNAMPLSDGIANPVQQ